MKKAQIAIESLFAIGIIFLIFFFVFIFSFNRTDILRKQEGIFTLQNECTRLSNLAHSVFIQGEGTTLTTNTQFLITVYSTGALGIKTSAAAQEFTCNPLPHITPVGEYTKRVHLQRKNNYITIQSL